MRTTTRTIHKLSIARRYRGQATVEWVIGAAVLAFVGIAAWTAAGGAITAAVTRLVGLLGQAGV
jgi:hypothetical protein